MSNTVCQDCGKEYDPDTVVKVSPVPDKACFNCMSTLTDEEIASAMERDGISVRENEAVIESA